MDTLQTELQTTYPILDIQIVGINEAGGYDVANEQMTTGRSLPWLQDVDSDNNQVSDVWYDQWDVTYRDVIIVDGQNQMVDVYNLTQNNLGDPDDYAEMRDKLIDAAMTEQKPWQNQRDRFDVNDDGHVVPLDVLLMINEIDATGPGELAPPTGTSLEGLYWDCDGDNYFAPIDILQVVNRVEDLHGGAEGEAADSYDSSTPSVIAAIESEPLTSTSKQVSTVVDVIESTLPVHGTPITPIVVSHATDSDDDRSLELETTEDDFWASYLPSEIART